MFEWIYSAEAWLALVTLTSLEIVLGIDNIIFISILVGRLPEHQRTPPGLGAGHDHPASPALVPGLSPKLVRRGWPTDAAER